MKAKVALAVAIIKSRPSGMSGREYAQALACKLRSLDESWKKKAQELQQEVLRLRQQLLMSRATSDTKSSTEAAGGSLVLEEVFRYYYHTVKILKYKSKMSLLILLRLVGENSYIYREQVVVC